MTAPTQLSLLRTRRFLPLFITQCFGAFNDNAFKNALVILLTYQTLISTGHSQLLVIFAAGIFILPFFLFSATAGKLADKMERSRLIRILKVTEILLVLLAIVGFSRHNISLLMGVLFLLGTQATFFGPVKYAILPDHLQENELVAGNGLIEASTFLAILLGTIFGGWVIATRPGVPIISVSLLAFAIAGWISSLFIPPTHNANAQLKIQYNFFAETLSIIRETRQQSKQLFLAILGISWFWLVGAVFLAQFSTFARDDLGANAHVVTLFLTTFSLGIALGALLCNRLLKGKVYATYVPLGALGMTLFMLDLYFAGHQALPPSTPLMGIFSLLSHFYGIRIVFDLLGLAICGGLFIVPLYALLQLLSDKAYRARVMACNNILNALFMVIAAIVTLFMLKIGFSITHIFLTMAIINAGVALYICKLLPEFLIKAVCKWALQLFYRVQVKGMEHYEAAGNRVVIIANHTSFLDAILLAAFLPDTLTFAINTFTAQKWWIRLFIRLVDAYPIDPTQPMAIKSLIEYVSQNKRCVIFPEGRISVTGTLMKIYEGPGLIADKAHAPLLPVRIEGAQLTPFSQLKGKIALHWFPQIRLTIFPAQQFNVPENAKGRRRRAIISKQLYDVMTNMLFASSPYQQTLFQGLLAAARRHGYRQLIAEDIERHPLTYRQVIMRSFILGRYIAKHSVPHENVGILLPNALATVITFFALHTINRVPALLNFSTGSKNVMSACRAACIKQIYTSRRFINIAGLTSLIAQLSESNIRIYYLEDLRNEIGIFSKFMGVWKSYIPLLAYRAMALPKKRGVTFDAQQAAVILFTSGSEGTPKGVVLSHQNIQANRFQISACVDFTPADKVFNALPLFHSFGLTAGMLLPLLSGIKVFFYPSPLHYRIVPEISYDTNATVLFGTDTFLSGYAKYAHPYDFYSMRYVFAGAEKLKEETRQLWTHKFGIRIFEGYGATETSPVLAINTPMYHRAGTVGKLLPGIQYRLEKIEGITDGERLWVNGPNIMLGYLHEDRPGILQPPPAGWYDTGDIVTIDREGFVQIKGRAKRFAKIGGEMISCTAVETAMNQLWPANQHAIIILPDEKKGEQLALVTTCMEATRDAIVKHAKIIGMVEIMLPKKIIKIKNLPLLGSGKTDYPAVLHLVQEQMLLTQT